jgi:hypothetical protein
MVKLQPPRPLRAIRLLAAALAGLLLPNPGAAQDFMPPDRPTPTDFEVQGEYFGAVEGGANLGAWVVGQGGDRYNVAFLPGGLLTLPGQGQGGWNQSVRHAGNGTAANLTTANGFKAAITGIGESRVMKGTTNEGKAFTLNRVLRKGPTTGMQPKPEWKAVHWFRQNTAADLGKWSPRPDAPQMKYGGYLFRGVTGNESHGTVFLHIEVKSPYCPSCRDQSRGNSGIYFRGMHEMQVLDSFGAAGTDNELGAIYKVKAPSVNAALPPLSWQSYDCYYTPGTGNSATLTVYLNGVKVQDKTVVNLITEAGFSGNSLYLQNHGSEVIYNNIWVVKDATEANFPYGNLLGPATGLGGEAGRIAAPRPRPSMLSWFGVEGGRDASGRAVSGGSRLRVLPVVSE